MSHIHQFIDVTPPGFHGHQWRCDCGESLASAGCTRFVGQPHDCPSCGKCPCSCRYCNAEQVWKIITESEST
jgi:hypothetical protein